MNRPLCDPALTLNSDELKAFTVKTLVHILHIGHPAVVYFRPRPGLARRTPGPCRVYKYVYYRFRLQSSEWLTSTLSGSHSMTLPLADAVSVECTVPVIVYLSLYMGVPACVYILLVIIFFITQEALVDSREGLVLSSTTPRQTSHNDDELTTPRGGVDGTRGGVIAVSAAGPRPKNGVVCRVTLLDGNECQVEVEVRVTI